MHMPTGPEQVDAEIAKLEALNRALVPPPSLGGPELSDRAIEAFVAIWELSLEEQLPESTKRLIGQFLGGVWSELDPKTKEWMSQLDKAWGNIQTMPPSNQERAKRYWNPIFIVARAAIQYYYTVSQPQGVVQFRDSMRHFDVS